MTMKLSEILEKAVDVLDERGWNSKGWKSSDGKLCILAAVNEAWTGKEDTPWGTGPGGFIVAAALLDSLEDVIGSPYFPYPGSWNDHVAEFKEQVQVVLFKAAKKLRAEGE